MVPSTIPGLVLCALVALAVALPHRVCAQKPSDLKSVEVLPDGRITFRYLDPKASKVLLNLEGVEQPQAMERTPDGVWTATTRPVPPQIYNYSFSSDGAPRLDPQNHEHKPNLVSFYRGNFVTVPGSTPQPWEPADLPHGTVHHHVYTTKCVTGLTGDQSDYFVYTPPGYDPKAAKRYPVLYLLHGWSDLAVGWTEVGRAHLIMDSLIARSLARAMVVVMPLSYGEMSFVRNWDAWEDPAARARNWTQFQRALLTEIIPRIESAYDVSREAKDRAITGLSMGGYESITIGLNHPEKFAWVGGFSSAVLELDYAKDIPSAPPAGDALRLLWIACGKDDAELIAPHRKLTSWLREKQFPVTAVETPGGHAYMVWRENLVQFAPLLFRP